MGNNLSRENKNWKNITTSAGESDIRNILIIGITGNGKSALANVLTDTSKFDEAGGGTSVTKNFQKSDVFEWQGKKYCIIDNIDFSSFDEFSKEVFLLKICEGIHAAEEGINQILFVFKDRFSPEQVQVFNLFKDFIFLGSRITEFTTLVRTNFESFRSEEKCHEDKEVLLMHTTEKLRKLIESCNDIIYVDNPSIPKINKKDSEKVGERKRQRINMNKEDREYSREIVLNHLAKNCPNIYKLEENVNLYTNELILDKREFQEWLDQNYPKKTRKDVKRLIFFFNKLEGCCNLNDFKNLEEINGSRNEITSLIIKDNKLKHLSFYKNKLTNLDFLTKTNLNMLTELYVNDNRFSAQDLSCFSHLVNLETLDISNNLFFGSLQLLQGMDKLEGLNISDTDVDSGLEHLPRNIKNHFRYSSQKRLDSRVGKIYERLTFYNHDIEKWKAWRKKGISEEESKQWITAGAKPDDYKFVTWLRGTKKETPQWVLDYQEDYQVLRDRFRKYGLCSECNQPNTGKQWCQLCNASRLQENFSNWTSGKTEIDQFIQKYQLEATDEDKFMEWIPYKQFADIEFLAQGGFGKVYKAKWTEGNVHHWDSKNKQWNREKDHYYEEEDKQKPDFEQNKNKYKKYKDYREVVLKSLDNSQDNTNFLQETEKHKIIDDWFNSIVSCYGLSQDPQSGDYFMVMQYMPEGNLRHYLGNKNQELSLEDKFNQLISIARGLKDIHQKDLVHRDFHSGNILKGIEKTSCLITDLGLCKPVNEASQEKKVFGVLPYVAPEVLRQQPYAQAADIYSWGIIAPEVLSGLPPYYDREHDANLGVSICNGLRPQFQIKIPQLLEDLINKCWNVDSKKRLTANELERTLRSWQTDTEFKKQLQEAEEFNKTLPKEVRFPDYKTKIHSGAVYHSKLLPTKEITQLLQNPEFSQSLQMNFEIPKETQTEEEVLEIQQEIPPK